MKKNIAILTLALVVFGLSAGVAEASAWGNLKFRFLNFFENRPAMARFIPGKKLPEGNRAFYGKIASVSGSTLIVEQKRGTSTESVSVLVNASTTIKGATSTSALVAGRVISGVGKENSDKTLTAVSLRLAPVDFPYDKKMEAKQKQEDRKERRDDRISREEGNGRVLVGKITAVSGSNLTVLAEKFLPVGRRATSTASTTLSVSFSDSTKISGGTKDGLIVGARIAVNGSTTDGVNIVAAKIQFEPKNIKDKFDKVNPWKER